jgi:hypothetical protein
MCGRESTHVVAGRGYCVHHADELARSVNMRVGRSVVRPTVRPTVTYRLSGI